AWKRAVEIEPVDWRGPARRNDGMDVIGRHQDEPTLDLARIELSRQLADDDRALVLVAVVSAFDDDRRPFAIGDDGDRNARYAPGVIMRRVRKHHPADLPALPVKVDGCEGGRGASRLAHA